jgi:hypothetical protein
MSHRFPANIALFFNTPFAAREASVGVIATHLK